jgi:hypothetical protein
MSNNTENIVLYAALGLGAYVLLQRRATAAPVYAPPSNRQGGILPSAGLATAAAGIVQLFGNLPWAKGADPRTVSPGYGQYAGGISTTAPAWESGAASDAAFNYGNGFLTNTADPVAYNAPNPQA